MDIDPIDFKRTHFKKLGILQEAETGPFAKMGNILRNNPENSLETLDDIKDLVINKKRVLGQVRQYYSFRSYVVFNSQI